MASVKIKFRPSAADAGVGKLFYQVIHNRIARQQRTSYQLCVNEWDNVNSEILLTSSDLQRRRYLLEIQEFVSSDIQRLQNIITMLDRQAIPYSADDVIAEFSAEKSKCMFFEFAGELIANFRSLGKVRCAETYATSLRSFARFRCECDVAVADIDSDMMMAYEAYLRSCGLCPNSSSFYMRNLRAIYNRAVEKGLATQHFPFKHVYTGVDKTIKRAIPLNVVKQIKTMDLSSRPLLDFSRDMFLFSFYTRGMSFVDMAYLRKRDLHNGMLVYRRRKTGQQLFVKWEECMQDIVDKYLLDGSPFLLPIINPCQVNIEQRRQYIYASHKINRGVRILGCDMGLGIPLTMYVARHAWASIAKSKNVPLSVISEGMGHDSESTTRIYLSTLDNVAVDRANRLILKSL